MHFPGFTIACLSFIASTLAVPHGHMLVKRYMPREGDCSYKKIVRKATTGINADEAEYIMNRQNVTVQVWKDYLERLALDNFDVTKFLEDTSKIPSVGIAISGGGYRAMLTGGGAYKAFDNRFDESKDAKTGGIVQLADYFSGVSGGSWLTTSMASNDFADIETLVRDVFKMPLSIFTPFDTTWENAKYYARMAGEIAAKRWAGFPISLTDFWGRMMSKHLLADDGLHVTFSSIAETNSWKNHAIPYVISVGEGVPNGFKPSALFPTNSTIYEFTVDEMGSWDDNIGSFSSMKYLGTEVDEDGHATGKCVTGLDNAGFVTGTSSAMIGAVIFGKLNMSNIPFVGQYLSNLNMESLMDESNWKLSAFPNVFKGFNKEQNSVAEDKTINMVDGATSGLNLPIWPLMNPNRNVDVIIAVDSSSDINDYPDGTAMVAAYNRSKVDRKNGRRMPKVPDTVTFLNNGLTTKPVFFGCNEPESVLIVYLPNSAYSFDSNINTMNTTTYSNEVTASMVQNGFNVATMGNNKIDENWSVCLGCALIYKGIERLGWEQTETCKSCFGRYCWVGQMNTAMADIPV
ncbi:Lysophospholipase 2 [Neolecta irregularis DAH-3]|uniref:Lysophospholipase n=1 Tax=Neolecta irregularis (strain DAH-3) TaxID=1198029 RepID=A0A1U7LR69_NEOID|nr:Lysophospholipase 2 [Neolecta irregularis DAH-3]|eukprot:OLL25011.1 Lysophospholipase 2 [Neolecta irregularis DAH-3]